MKSIRDMWLTSRVLLYILTALAVVFSVVAIVAERKQGFSVFWTVSGDTIECTYAMPPHYSVTREYTASAIEAVDKAPYSQDATVDVVVLRFSSLNYSIPSQSSEGIRDFDAHIGGLQTFLARVKEGDQSARHRYYHPLFVTMLVAAGAAILTWITLFVVLWLTRSKSRAGDDLASTAS